MSSFKLKIVKNPGKAHISELKDHRLKNRAKTYKLRLIAMPKSNSTITFQHNKQILFHQS